MKVLSICLGCPKNRVDTERLLAALGHDVEPVDRPEEAGVVLVNTCGFIAPAVEESVHVIAELAESLKEMPLTERPLMAVAGCLVSRYGKEELAEGFPEVDLWLNTRELGQWPAMLDQALVEKPGSVPPGGRVLSTGPSYAYLKIAEGCSHTCSFCTIPSIRGKKTVSQGPASLVEEARVLLDQGVKELVLVAQDVTGYGRDLGKDHSLRGLLEQLLPLPGLEWLRLMYLYPAGLDDDLLGFMAQAAKDTPLLPYLDVPLQHAHPGVLKRMGRPFARDPRRVLERTRRHLPDAALRTSLITGFPGEGEAEFRALVELVREVRFHNLGVFAFCPEQGTPAADMPGQVPSELAQERRNRIMELQAGISEDILAELQGEILDVLVDEPDPEWPGLHRGRAWFQAPEVDGVTYVSGPGVEPGKMVKAVVEDTKTYDIVALI